MAKRKVFRVTETNVILAGYNVVRREGFGDVMYVYQELNRRITIEQCRRDQNGKICTVGSSGWEFYVCGPNGELSMNTKPTRGFANADSALRAAVLA